MASIRLIFMKANPFLDDFNYSILTLNKLIIIIMIERSTREREREREREIFKIRRTLCTFMHFE